MEVYRWKTWLITSSFGILLGATAKLGPLASTEIVTGDRLLLNRFLTVLNRGLGIVVWDYCISLSAVLWTVYGVGFRIVHNVNNLRFAKYLVVMWKTGGDGGLKDFWEILFICNLVKLMRLLVRIRPVLWRMFLDLLVSRWFLTIRRNFGTMLLFLQHFRNTKLERFLAKKIISLLNVLTLARILYYT